ncbi:MAG: glyoxalase/bleomycin resistance/dioxygenase family protein, partial [Rhizomicrobium sp.]
EATTCCYARSNKSWVEDPSGVRWETFFTFDEATTYGEDASPAAEPKAAAAAASEACCGGSCG